jgi:hypothetical protein
VEDVLSRQFDLGLLKDLLLQRLHFAAHLRGLDVCAHS